MESPTDHYSWRLGPFKLDAVTRVVHRIDIPTWAFEIEKSFHKCMEPMTNRFLVKK